VIGTLFWKEYREHRGVWLVLAFLGVTSVVSANVLTDWFRLRAPQETAVLFAFLITFIYGLICGALMLAGEYENRTLEFLDILGGRRTHIWVTKATAGAAFTLAQALFLWVVLAITVSRTDSVNPFALLPGLIFASLIAYGWGLFSSGLFRSVLVAALVTVPLITVALLVSALLSLAANRLLPGDVWRIGSYDIVQLALWGLLTAAAVAGSWHFFCRRPIERRGRIGLGLGSLLWLNWQQGRRLLLTSLIVLPWLALALLFSGVGIWPVATLLLGVAFGTAVFGGEQTDGAHRFLADQRLPLRRVWLVKTLFWFAAAAVLAGLLYGLQTALARLVGTTELVAGRPTMVQLFQSDRLLSLTLGWGHMLLLWGVYGFCFAQFLALLFRKTLTAVALALTLSGAVLVLWLPSVVAGGVRPWQTLLLPVALLALSGLAVRPWAADRMRGWKIAGFAVVAGLVGTAWMAANLSYRFLQYPGVGPPFDVKAFAASLPPPEKNEAGSLIRQAAQELRPVAYHLGLARSYQPNVTSVHSAAEKVRNQIEIFTSKGWPKGDSKELEQALDQVFSAPWYGTLQEAAAHPTGMVEDPRQQDWGTGMHDFGLFYPMITVLSARTAQFLEKDDHREALEQIKLLLAFSRNLRRGSGGQLSGFDRLAETYALDHLERWLQSVLPDRRLLQTCLTILAHHEAERFSHADQIKAQYLVTRNTLEDPASWFPRTWRVPELVPNALRVPWEKERLERIVNALYAGRLNAALAGYPAVVNFYGGYDAWRAAQTERRSVFHGLWLPTGESADLSIRTADQIERYFREQDFIRVPSPSEGTPLQLCRLRATRLQVALALFQVTKGRPSKTLDELVPEFLKELPLDPFSDQSFRYRVSQGEKILRLLPSAEEATLPRTVAAGQGVLWSVGPDLQDDRGRQEADRDDQRGSDLIFLVPHWPREKMNGE
jgi:ABC-type transport system involved in multi-copper enzyme maturation permease subunit